MLGYTFRYQLFVYSCDSWLFIYKHVVFGYPSVICLSCHLVILCLQFILLFLCAHCLYARALLFTHTLIGSLSDDHEFVRPDIGRFLILFRCSMRLYTSRGAGLSSYLIPVFLSFLPSCYFLILDILDSVVIPVLYLYNVMRGCSYVILQQSWFIIVSIYSLFLVT